MDSLLMPVFMLLLVVTSIALHTHRSRSLLERWAERNGYQIIDADYRNLFRGPFFWTTAKGQTVYRVTVEDEAGIERSGWVRCGSQWLGLLSDRVEVRWDEFTADTTSPMHARWLDG
jgi:hypothetical protein